MDNFDQWLNQCNRVTMAKLHGISLHDMTDASWRDYYDSELTPTEAVEAAMEDYWIDDLAY